MLFIGNYFSRERGTMPVMERIARLLQDDGVSINLTSKRSFWLWRAYDHLIAIYFTRYSLAFIDVFSDRSFLLVEWAVFWLRLRRKKFILTLRGGKLAEFSEQSGERVLNILRKANLVQTPSLFLKDYFSKKGIEVEYMPNPIDLINFPFLIKPTLPARNLLWVRAFTSIYNPEISIKVLKKVIEIFPDASLTMIGPDKGLLNRIQKLTNDFSLSSSVSFPGPIPNHQLASYYQSHAVYLNTTSYESFGVAVVEAASCGIPVVSFRVGEIPYLWKDEENILLAPLQDVDMMSNQVIRLFRDQELRTRISLEARKNAEKFSWEHIRPRWIKLMEQ